MQTHEGDDVEAAAEPAGLHPLLAGRWSPARFDTAHEATDGQVEQLIEAARWAPSAGNSQPWAFIAARRGDAVHERLVSQLARSSLAWAPSASVLFVNLRHRFVADTDWEYSEFSGYDLGQAVAHMTVQARAMGLQSRQFRAFDRSALSREFALPDHWEAATMTAFGRPAEPGGYGGEASGARPDPPRLRRSARDLLWPGIQAD